MELLSAAYHINFTLHQRKLGLQLEGLKIEEKVLRILQESRFKILIGLNPLIQRVKRIDSHVLDVINVENEEVGIALRSQDTVKLLAMVRPGIVEDRLCSIWLSSVAPERGKRVDN
jgi:hypothetical protein